MSKNPTLTPQPLVTIRRNDGLTVTEVARILKISEGKVRKLAEAGALECERDGSDYRRFHPTDVAHYLFKEQAKQANIKIADALQKVHQAGIKARENRRER